MPVTTILQHQRERERLTQPDLDTPVPDHDQGPSLREQMQEAAAVAARWTPPDSSYNVEILNRPFNPGPSKASTSSPNKGSSGVYNANQTMGGEKVGPPQGFGNPPDDHNARRPPPTDHTSNPEAAYEVQHHDPQGYSSQAHNSGRISPDIYNVTHRAVNALWAHRRAETASNDSNAWQAASPSFVKEQTAPRIYNTPYTRPASQSSTQTPPLEYNGRQAPYADNHTGLPSPVEWVAVRASPRAPSALEAGSGLRQNDIAHRRQASSATVNNQPQQTSGWQHAYSQSTTAPRPASLQHAATSSQSVMSLKNIVAPQSPAVAHPTMTAPPERPPQPEVAPRWAAPSYPTTMRQGAVASQATSAPQPPVIPNSAYTQPAHSPQPAGSRPAYTQPTEAQPLQSLPYHTQPAFSEPSHPQLHPQPACSEPGCSLPDCLRPYNPQSQSQPQPVYSQPVAASQQVNVAQAEAVPRPLASPQSTISSNSPATPWSAETSQATTAAQQLALSQYAMFSQPIAFRTMATSYAAGSPQQLPIRPAAAGASRSSARKGGRESTMSPQGQGPRSLYDQKGSAIVEMTPSFGNKVVEFLLKYDPSMVAGSQVSNTLPKETAVHYNSVLAYQAQSLGLSFPHGRPEFYNGIDPRLASPQVTPASQGAQGMQRTVTHTGRTQPFQQGQSTAVSPRHGQFDTPAPQSDAQTQVPPARDVHYRSTSCVGHPQATAQQSPGGTWPLRAPPPNQYLNEEENWMAGAGSRGGDVREVSQMDWQTANEGNRGRRGDIQVVSRHDWQAANEDTSGHQFAYGAQPFVNSAPQNTTSQPSSSAPEKTQSALQPCVTDTKGMPLPRAQRPIPSQTTPAASTRVQASRRAKSKAYPTPASGGVQKRRSNRVRQTTPHRPAPIQPALPKNAVSRPAVPQNEVPQTPLPSSGREQQPIAFVSGSGLELTQDDVNRWQEERQNPYRLPSFNDAFGHIIMDETLTDYQQPSYEAEGGRFNLAAYRI